MIFVQVIFALTKTRQFCLVSTQFQGVRVGGVNKPYKAEVKPHQALAALMSIYL